MAKIIFNTIDSRNIFLTILVGCEEIKTNPAFAKCHATVNPDDHVKACEQETCKCKYGGDCNCFCSAVAAYVRECNRLGISFKWRREGFCGGYH